jgi:hypothetical protein
MMRRIRPIAVLAVVGLASAGIAWSPAGADDFTSFEARATAEGFRFTFGAPGFVAVDTFIDGGGPVASSVLDGLGNSQSFASLAYPSDNAISGPGLVAGLTGLPSPPPYPFYVNSSYPTQERRSTPAPASTWRRSALKRRPREPPHRAAGEGAPPSAPPAPTPRANATPEPSPPKRW